MNVIRYFLYRYIIVIYSLVAAIMSLIISMAVWDTAMFAKVIVPVASLLFALRIQDDIYDYDSDRTKKKQYPTKKQLVLTNTAMWLIFIISNITAFGVMGVFGILFPVYTLLWEHIQLLKILFAPLVFLYYVLPHNGISLHITVLEAVICTVVSLIYYIIKKGGSK